jgi:hypothetical protein
MFRPTAFSVEGIVGGLFLLDEGRVWCRPARGDPKALQQALDALRVAYALTT